MSLRVNQETSTVGKQSLKSLMASLLNFVVYMNSMIVGVYLESVTVYTEMHGI
jgi:hypothetical protein